MEILTAILIAMTMSTQMTRALMRRLLLPTEDLWLIRPTRQRMWSPIKKRLLRPDTLQLLRLAKPEDQAAGETPPAAEQSPRLQSPPAPESEPPVLHQHVHAKGKPEPSRLTLTPGPGARMTQDDEGPVDREDFNDVVSAVRDLTGEVRTLAEKLREQQRSGHRSADSGWLSRKRQRAADYRASGGRAPRPATEMSLPMCVHCKRNQRGVSCSSQMCRLCCQSDACQQHGRR